MIHYTKAYIKDLLDKYMDGTSTLEEEDILAKYFRGKDVPQEWEDYRQLFQEIEAMKPKTSKRWIGWGECGSSHRDRYFVCCYSVCSDRATAINPTGQGRHGNDTAVREIGG